MTFISSFIVLLSLAYTARAGGYSNLPLDLSHKVGTHLQSNEDIQSFRTVFKYNAHFWMTFDELGTKYLYSAKESIEKEKEIYNFLAQNCPNWKTLKREFMVTDEDEDLNCAAGLIQLQNLVTLRTKLPNTIAHAWPVPGEVTDPKWTIQTAEFTSIDLNYLEALDKVSNTIRHLSFKSEYLPSLEQFRKIIQVFPNVDALSFSVSGNEAVMNQQVFAQILGLVPQISSLSIENVVFQEDEEFTEQAIKALKNLKKLRLTRLNSKFIADTVSRLGDTDGNTKIEELEISNTALTQYDFRYLRLYLEELSHLKWLKLSNVGPRSLEIINILGALNNLTSLKTLDISNIRFKSGDIPAFAAAIRALLSLENLNVAGSLPNAKAKNLISEAKPSLKVFKTAPDNGEGYNYFSFRV